MAIGLFVVRELFHVSRCLMKLLTKIKFIGVITALAGGIGFLVSRFGGQVQRRLKDAQKKRELQDELAAVLGEKARIEEALRQLETPDVPDEDDELGDGEVDK